MSIFGKIVSTIMLILGTAFLANWANAIEQPKFEVVGQIGDVEIRKYPSQLVARTLVSGEFSEVSNQGFRVLAGYIFGGNVEEQKIAMTAPVSLKPDSATALQPQYWVTFNMPEEYAREELPEPDDSRVNITEVPERYLAVLRYKGNWSEARYRQHESALLSQLTQASAWQTQGATSWARYNAPFTPWFMRTNEVAIEVVAKQQGTR